MGGQERDSTRHREAAAASRAETRARLVAAAGELFAHRGYAATTVAEIARRAGVSVQTLYLACGSKRELLRTVLGQALSGTAEGVDANYVASLSRRLEAATGSPGPHGHLHAIARVFRTIAERAAPWWKVYRDAAGIDPEIATDWTELNAGRRTTTSALLAGPVVEQLRPGIDHDRAVDTVWTVASPETCDLLVGRAGYTFDAYERWVADTLVRALLP